MYEGFYGFSEGPFNFGPDPRFLYLTPSHAEAYSGMLYGVRERKGITVITGDSGIGKTTLIRALLSELNGKVRTAFVVFTLLEFGDLLKSILYDLGIPAKGQDDLALLETFYLDLSERPQDEIVGIIIDEAQGLDTSVLKDLTRLWASPTRSYPQLQTILMGHTELDAKLDSEELASLRERIAVRRHIRPLTRQESNAYIDHRLRMVGSSSSEVFTREAVDRICDYAGGIPRVINMICDGSLLIGYAKYRRKIDTKMVEEAIEDLRLPKPKETKRTLPAEGPRPEESMPEPVPARSPWWRPAYELAAGSLLAAVTRLRSLERLLRPTDGAKEPEPLLTTEAAVESLTAEPMPKPLMGEAAPEPVPAPRLWWSPVYQLLAWVRSLKPVPHPAADGEEPVPVPEPILTAELPEPLTIESPLEPLQPEESRRGEPAPEPVPVPRPRWQPVHHLLERLRSLKPALHPAQVRTLRWRPAYQTLTGALLVVMVLGLFTLLILDLVPPKETKVKGIGTVTAEKESTFSLRAEQNQGLVPVPSASVKRERPQRLAHKQRKPLQPLAHDKGEPPQPLAYKQGEPPQPLAHDKGEPLQPLAPYRLNDEERADLLLKQDPAWSALQR